jgi:SAM-dependent methyltransferase
MARPWESRHFDEVYERFICEEKFNCGGRAYFVRYRSRYKECIKQFAALAPPHPVNVLDIGGGSLALLAAKLWNDHCVTADLPGPHFDYIASHGVETVHWNVCNSDPPFEGKFDFVFFSEVIEHLPIPGHLVLRRLAKALKPGGVLICTTPNLYRLRNVVYMMLGRRIFVHFQYPNNEIGLGHVLEYDREHLDWQFKQAGFTQYRVEYRQFHHMPTNPLYRPFAMLGYPLHLFPRWRDNLVATAYAPSRPDSEEHKSEDKVVFAT